MKVALIAATGGDKRSYGTPLGLGYLATYLKRELPEVDVQIYDKVKKACIYKPDLLGVSSVSSCIEDACRIAKEVRMSHGLGISVLGGAHATSAPGTCIPNEFDVVVRGAGEKHIVKLCQIMMDGHPMDTMDWEQDDPCVSPPPGLPRPFRSKNSSDSREQCIITSRGCPFSCGFCCSRIWGKFRQVPVHRVLDELHAIASDFPRVTKINILDDLFCANADWLWDFVKQLQKTGLSKRFTFRGFVRSSIMDGERMLLLSKMPMTSIRFGAESASQRILDILKPKSTVEDHVRCTELADQYGIKCQASWIVGAPGETPDDLLKTIKFIRRWKKKLGIAGFYLATPFPGTPFWEIAKSLGVVEETPDFDWSRLNLDFCNPDFDPVRACYMNGRILPLSGMLAILEEQGIRPKIMKRHLEKMKKGA